MIKSEFQLIDLIQKKIPRKLQGPYGIGDDGAVLPLAKGKCQVFTTDAIVDGVDFESQKHSPEKVGRKALAINLSDLAAMGAMPEAFVITLGIPKSMKGAWILRFYQGMMKLAAKYKTSCVGGDITASPKFFASIALWGKGKTKEMVWRHGAKAGDLIAVTGKLGASRLRHQFEFEPRVQESQFLVRNFKPSAMLDISDGLLQDLTHLLKNSKLSAVLDTANIPISKEVFKLSGDNCQKALEHALTDGEDFELLFTLSPNKKKELEKAWKKKFPKVPLSWIGKVQQGKPQIRFQFQGKMILTPQFKRWGYRHF